MPEGPALIVSVFILFLSFIPLAFSIFYCVIFYKALWNIYAIFADGKATLYLILSIFLPVQPFLLFAIRNNEPVNVLNYNAVPVVIDTPYVVETDE